MLVEERVREVASKLGDPQMVLINALKKEVFGKILELTLGVQGFEEKYKTSLEGFEQENLLDKSGPLGKLKKITTIGIERSVSCRNLKRF